MEETNVKETAVNGREDVPVVRIALKELLPEWNGGPVSEKDREFVETVLADMPRRTSRGPCRVEPDFSDPGADEPCPCGSGRAYGECCLPFHDGKGWPATPEELVRARYSAHVKRRLTYILFTQAEYHDFRGIIEQFVPLTVELAAAMPPELEWLGLNILGTGEDRQRGAYVDFTYTNRIPRSPGSDGNGSDEEARDGQRDVVFTTGERSFFVRRGDRVYYTSGIPLESLSKEMREYGHKVGRNDPCPCGSGKKYKKCCGAKA